jgi:hypothetical protein
VELWREAAAVCAVFGLLGVAIWTLRSRVGIIGTRAGKSLTAVERIALTPHHALHLVHAPGRELLVATHPQGCTLLLQQPLVEQALSAPSLPGPARCTETS